MKAFFKNNGFVLLLYLISLATALYFIYLYKNTTIHIYLNQFVGNYYLNLLFHYITYLGDGTVAVFILLIILIYNLRLGIYTTISFLSASLFSIMLKELVFDDVNRPWFAFQYEETYVLNLVEGVSLYIHNSFPSGHATQAFAIFMCLVYVVKNQYLKFGIFFIALLTALSRVYISQHWLADITAGSFIGTSFSIIYYYVFIIKNKFPQLNRPIGRIKQI